MTATSLGVLVLIYCLVHSSLCLPLNADQHLDVPDEKINVDRGVSLEDVRLIVKRQVLNGNPINLDDSDTLYSQGTNNGAPGGQVGLDPQINGQLGGPNSNIGGFGGLNGGEAQVLPPGGQVGFGSQINGQLGGLNSNIGGIGGLDGGAAQVPPLGGQIDVGSQIGGQLGDPNSNIGLDGGAAEVPPPGGQIGFGSQIDGQLGGQGGGYGGLDGGAAQVPPLGGQVGLGSQINDQLGGQNSNLNGNKNPTINVDVAVVNQNVQKNNALTPPSPPPPPPPGGPVSKGKLKEAVDAYKGEDQKKLFESFENFDQWKEYCDKHYIEDDWKKYYDDYYKHNPHHDHDEDFHDDPHYDPHHDYYRFME